MKREEAGAGADSRSHSALTHRRVRGHGAHGRPGVRGQTRTPCPTSNPLVATGDTASGAGDHGPGGHGLTLTGYVGTQGVRLPPPRCEPTRGGSYLGFNP